MNLFISRDTKIIIIVVILISSYFLNLSNIMRYHLEKTFGKPLTFTYHCNVGVMQDKNNWYDEEFDLNDNIPIIDLNKYKNPSLYFYGRYVNSNDSAIISVNGKVLSDIDINDNSFEHHFWEKFYLEKTFVAKIPYHKGKNEIILTTGNFQNKYYVNIK